MRTHLRWALPIFHLAMDMVLAAVLIGQTLLWIHHPTESGFNRGSFVSVAYNPQPRYVFDPRVPGSIGPASLLITGCLPAGIVASFTLAETRGLLDFPYGCLLWLGSFEGLAIPMWIFASRLSAAHGWCVASIYVRVLASLFVFSKLWGLGAGLQTLLWVSAVFYGMVVFARRLIKRT